MSEDEYIRIMNVGREITAKELISEFVDDLKQITWLIGKAPIDMGFYIKKWEDKQ